MTTQNLLVELFVEELPPKALQKLGDAFGRTLFARLEASDLLATHSILTTYASPRRLAAHITAVKAQAPDKPMVTKLMSAAAAFDTNGKPTPALQKKTAKDLRCAAMVAQWPNRGDGPDQLYVEGEGKAETLFFRSLAAGYDIRAGLSRALGDAISCLPIPKVMTYQLDADCELPGWTSVQFVRPAHGLVALHGANVVPVEALGLAAGNTTRGHRFEAKVDPVALRHADSYAQQLAEEGAVIASFTERRADIARQLAAAAAQVGNGVHAVDDAALLDEVTALVERPNVLLCSFEKEFLDVPQECLILTMKANQKYFPLMDAAGKLTHRFLVVSNITPEDASLVIGGNERVIRPRLADAKFFFDQDRKKTLTSRVESLGKVVYHNKLGTQGERVERVRAIATSIARKLGDENLVQQADQAAQLAKADLVSDMVGEFPELQGTMGRYYALNDGLADAVADAIEDHYKPRFAGDSLPRNRVGMVLALADKLETLVGMFGIGSLPTGDRDPFALRRHALGVIRMLIEAQLPLHYHELTRAAFSAFPTGLLQDRSTELDEFLIERLKGYLRDGGFSAAQVDAAIYAHQLGQWSTIPQRLAAVCAFAALPEAPALAAANKRIANILKKAGEVDPHVNAELLQEQAERDLYAALQRFVPEANAQFDAGDFTGSLQTLAVLRGPVDAFFDDVMVNAEQLDLRLNRQGLLKSLHTAMNRVADLSRLAV